MKIGALKEISTGEQRVALTPESAIQLQKLGHECVVQKGAGSAAGFSDAQYKAAGVEVAATAAALTKACDVIVKVRPPTEAEIKRLSPEKTLISFFYPGANEDLMELAKSKGASVIAMDMVPRISRAQKMDALSSMANIAGYRAVIEAGNNFGRFFTGQVTAAGKVPPAKVLVVGAGVAGLAAIGTSTSLGAITYAFDVRPEVAEQVESMGAEFVFLDFSEEQADGAATGGYAAVSSPEFAAAQLAKFREIAPDMDIVITTALIPNREAPELWTADMVASMKPGSVIIDLAAEKGGNCKLTVMDERIVTDNGVIIIGYTDFPSRMAAQASTLYANNIRHMVSDLTPEKDGVIVHDMEDDVIRGATIAHAGEITFPPPPPKIQAIAAKPKEKLPEKTAEEKRRRGAGFQKANPEPSRSIGHWWGAAVFGRQLRTGKLYAAFYRVCSVGLCRLPSHLECQPFVAYAVDGGDQCDFLDHHLGRGAASWIDQLPCDRTRGDRGVLCGHQHFWRLSRNPAHACHVPEILRRSILWKWALPPPSMLLRLFFSFCPSAVCRAKKVPNGPFGMALSAWRWR